MWLAIVSPVAFAEGSSTLGGTSGSPLESPLVVPEGLSLLGGQSVRDAEEARRVSPAAAIARQESQTKYEGLSAGEASKLAGEVFPGVVDDTAGGPPQLPEGQHITGFISADAAQVTLPSGESGHAVLESMEPIATESSLEKWTPINLSLSQVGGVFRVANPAVDVNIPKRLQGGVSLLGSGVSLTPVDASGAVAGGSEGRVDGSVVFYGGVGVGGDVDEVVKPESSGFSEDAILRSVASPARLVYRVGLPEHASLIGPSEGSRVATIMEGGSVIAAVSVPLAHDAAGAIVPVSVSVEGDLLVVTVSKSQTEYEYPILVDPLVEDEHINKGSGYTTNWRGKTSEGATGMTVEEKAGWKLGAGNISEHEWAAVEYTTQGESYIEKLTAGAGEAKGSLTNVESWMELLSPAFVVESKLSLPGAGSFAGDFVCTVEPSCREGKGNSKGNANNTAEFLASANHSATDRGELWISKATVEIKQEKGPEISVDTSHENVDGGKRNIFYGGGGWLGPNSGGFELHAKDPGIGVSNFYIHAGKGTSFFTEENNYIEHSECTGGVQCFPEVNKGYGYESQLLNGEDTLEAYAKDAMGSVANLATQKIKVDNEPPHGITFSGLPSSHEVRDGQHPLLEASATDGIEGTPSSGLASIMLDIDGLPVSGPQGYCSPGPCTRTAQWTINGENYAAGEHTLTVVATDNAGNAETATYHMTIHHVEGVPVGPGSVNPVTGELSMAATDVSQGVPGGALTVSRSYRSRHVAQGTEGPLGPQWNLALGAQQSLLRVSGGMVLTGGSGEQVVFEGKGGGEFTSPTGDAGLTLLEKPVEGKTVFTLSENGSVTTFELPVGSSGSVWMPSITEGRNGTNKTLYKFKVENGVIEPTEELAPVPAGVSCGKEISELEAGCRALKFEYATETKAKGEKASEWNEFIRHLSRVKYIAWNSSKAKTERTIAEYAYDKKGRLRAEWNPEITPSLKTDYGYDVEEHVTAVSTPGHEPMLLEQGTTPSDSGPGRLLAVAIPSAATALGNGEAPTIKEKGEPTLSSTKPVVGTKISVNLTSEKTPGTWTGSPLAFIYQWEDCNSSGKECSPIPGAVNQAYYPVASDEGHTLIAEATALNATGAVTASSAATSTVALGTPNTPLPEPPAVGTDAVTTLEYQVPVSGSGAPYEMSSTELAKWGQSDDPGEAMAVFPPSAVMGWPAKEYKRETVYYLDGKDHTVNTALPTGGISMSEYNLYNDITRTLTPNNRLRAVTEGCKASEECKSATENTYEETGSEPGTELLSTLGPQHTVDLAAGKEGKVNEEALARERTNYYYNEGAPTKGGPYHLVTKTVDFAETAGKEFDKRTTEISYSGQGNLGWELRKPTSVTIDPSGLDLVHVTEYNSLTGSVTETKMPAASGKDAKVPPTYKAQFGSKGSGAGQANYPYDDTIDSHGNLWVSDVENDRVDEFSSSGAFIEAFGFGVGTKGEEKLETCTSTCKAGKAGSDSGQFSFPAGIAFAGGDLYVADWGNDRIEVFNEKIELVTTIGSKGTGAGQFEGPVAVEVAPNGNIWVGDSGNNRLEEFKSSGAFIEAIGFGVNGGTGKVFEVCTSSCKAGLAGSGNGQFAEPSGIAFANGAMYVAEFKNARVQEFNEKYEYAAKFGSKGTGNGEFEAPESIAVSPANGDLYVADIDNDRVEEFTTSGSYLTQFGSKGSTNGQLKEPAGVAISTAGEIYVSDTDNYRIEEWAPTITGNEGAHDTKTIYYTKASNSEYKECGEHPEMANLPCETLPAGQPGTSGLPELPTTKYTFNVLNEPETTTEKVGSTERTNTNTYDAAGRPKTLAISSTVGEPVPTVTDEFNKETGALEKQCQNEGKLCVKGIDNKLGQLESYIDAGGNTTTFEYEKEKEARLVETNDQQGTEKFEYSETTGLPDELIYTNGTTKLTFTATRDVEGNILTESWPNGMSVTWAYDSVDKPISLVYKKTTSCTEEEKEKCKWFKDTVTPSIHGQWLEQASTFSHQNYFYASPGNLTEVQNITGGKCTTRLYAYDEDINRTSLTTREASTEKCATEGGTIQEHKYDTADRLTDPGIAYNPLGDITTLPAADAEANAEHPLTNTYYTNNQVASQTQNEQTIGYKLDPAGRTLETASTGKPNNFTTLSHYAGPSSAPAWTINPVSGEWRRNIMGLSGSLVAIQNNGETPELELINLHGDVIAKAYLSETATGLASKADTSEFGVPTVTAPAKYSWLGASELPTELPSGVISMGARSYVPQIGRFLQPDPVPGGSANAYSYTFGDPVNSFDPTGEYVECSYCTAVNDTQNREAVERQTAREVAAREAFARVEAEHAAREAAEAAAAAAGPQYSEEGEEWEEWEEEGEYEDAAYQQEAEQEASFGPGVRITVSDTTELHAKAAVFKQSDESSEEGQIKPAPEEKCGGGAGDENALNSSNSEMGSREYVHARQCPRQKSYPRGRRWHVDSTVAGRGQVRYEHDLIGCMVGGAVGGTFVAASTIGLATEAGAYGGCVVGAGFVELFGL